MNKTRRNALNDIQNRIEAIKAKFDFSELMEELSSIAEDLETLQEEEQEYKDNMPENWQDGEKGEMADEAIGYMEEAHTTLTDMIEAFESIDADNLDSAFENIDNAKGQG